MLILLCMSSVEKHFGGRTISVFKICLGMDILLGYLVLKMVRVLVSVSPDIQYFENAAQRLHFCCSQNCTKYCYLNEREEQDFSLYILYYSKEGILALTFRLNSSKY